MEMFMVGIHNADSDGGTGSFKKRRGPNSNQNNQWALAMAVVLSEGSNNMADGSAEGITFGCILDSVVVPLFIYIKT